MAGDQSGLVSAFQLQDALSQVVCGCIEFNGGRSEAAHSGDFQKNPGRIPIGYASCGVCTLVRAPALR
jgi:hypothetical protein